MKYIWIIGCGRFGKIALQRLSAQMSEKRFVVVDPDPSSLAAQPVNVETVNQDGVSYLKQHLNPQNAPAWIIPALPVHLAALWCMTGSETVSIKRCAPPRGLAKKAPNAIYGSSGDIYTSMTTLKCPDNCPEPASHCPVTGKKREENLFDKLKRIKLAGFEMQVIRSRQLAPGVGGYRPESLFELKQKLSQSTGNHLIATACRCHGVITPVISAPRWQSCP